MYNLPKLITDSFEALYVKVPVRYFVVSVLDPDVEFNFFYSFYCKFIFSSLLMSPLLKFS